MQGAGGRFLSRADTNADPLTTPKFGMMTDRARTYEGIRNNGETLETMVSMEKPIIAKVNGDAVGIGATLVFFCDLVIANEDAYISDSHIALHHLSPHLARGIGVVPGDGGAIGWPLQMSLFKAKEYLMLGRPVKARELADIHVINWAVPAAELDARVAEIVGELLEHPAWALAWSKLVLNKHVKDRLNLVHDLSFSLEAHSMRISELEEGKGMRKL
jgi:enoyl-CoA hydratase